VINLPAAGGLRIRRRFWDVLLYPAALGLALLVGASVVTDFRMAKALVALPCLVFALTIPPEKLFVGWLFCAPLVEGASGGQHYGHAFFKYLFFVPPLILAARMAMGAVRRPHLWVIDALPALYLAYILVRGRLLPSEFAGNEASLRGIYGVVGIAVLGYYFTAFGETSDQFPMKVARTLLWSGVVVASFALIDAATGWNLWHNTTGGNGQVRRVSATLDGPVPLGTFLATGLAFAVAILVWKGPRPLRLPARLLIGLSVPALYFTYTRGPILGVAVVAVSMALIANRARWPSLLVLTVVGVLLFAIWHDISSSTIYKERLGVTSTVTVREAIQHESVELFREKPVFGWGYNTFDRVKLTLPNPDPNLKTETSHDTYLTVLVELGVTGLVLLLLPWVVVAWRAVAAGRRRLADPWIIGGCVGTVVAFAIGALTYDARFFSFTSALPWIVLGLARSRLMDGGATPEPQSS
jgi:O-Antigen ligase